MKKIPTNKLTQDIFIERVNKFNNNLDFSKFIYINNSTKGEVICPNHGSFFTTPSVLMNGSGCRKCKMKANGLKNIELARKKYFNKCIEMHGEKYDYSCSVYNRSTFTNRYYL